ncbi:hypothetical protein RJB92_07000 [Staphylococcus hominis]|uniref:hypothetical protein n=1 Tax=Staphylococcus hominis TaxID=1290 RepID=UPI00287AA5FC|nr:hypothetical protein [Staphylococcus hominis]MDS3867929.1 hypothetical protein [Staphylococcus hominis]
MKKINKFINHCKDFLEKYEDKIKYIFQNILLSLFISPFILLSYLLIISLKLSLDSKYNQIATGILSIFLIYNTILLILGALYVALFSDEKKRTNFILFPITLLAFIYPFVYIYSSSQKLGIWIALNMVFVSLTTGYFITIGIRKLYYYVFSNKNEIKNKLSFINKILIGIITLIGSIVSLILSIQKIFN